MAQQLSEFAQIEGLPNVWCARRGSLRCTAIKLKGGGLVLFSPVLGLTAQGREQLQSLGPVRFLLAPNHYHNKALTEYSHAFPDAAIVAPPDAHERLGRVTGLSFDGLTALRKSLPQSVKLLTTVGLKTAEIWLRIKTQANVTWVVVDAFCTRVTAGKSPDISAPALLGTFPKMGVADKQIYGEWVRKQIAQDQPSIVIPCHGLVIRAVALPSRLEALIATL